MTKAKQKAKNATKARAKVPTTKKSFGSDVAKRIADRVKKEDASAVVQAATGHTEKASKKLPLTVGETKLGLTIVLPVADLEALGIPSDCLRRDAHVIIREKLGLATRGAKA